jgi:hypothetical protein
MPVARYEHSAYAQPFDETYLMTFPTFHALKSTLNDEREANINAMLRYLIQ